MSNSSNSPIVTAYRDALYRNLPVNKAVSEQQIRDSESLTEEQKIMCIEDLNLIEWKLRGGYTGPLLINSQERLKALFAKKSNASNETSGEAASLKWGKIQVAGKKLVVDTLSRFSTSSPKSQDKIKQENLLLEIDKLLKKVQKEEQQANQNSFEKLQSALNDELSVNRLAFMRNVIFFRKECDKESKDYADTLAIYVNLLSNEDLEKIYEKIHSEAMVALTNAFFTQHYLLTYEDDVQNLTKNGAGKAFDDALSIWEMNKGWMRAKVLKDRAKMSPTKRILDLDKVARKQFLSEAEGFFTFIMTFNDCVKRVMKQRRLTISEDKALLSTEWPVTEPELVRTEINSMSSGSSYGLLDTELDSSNSWLDERDSSSEWPVGLRFSDELSEAELGTIKMKVTTSFSNELPATESESIKMKTITIVSDEKILVGETIKSFLVPGNDSIKQMQPKNFEQRKKLDLYYFGSMVQSLGCVFNPNRFCDILFTIQPNAIKNEVMGCDLKTLKSCYKTFQSNDLNKLVSLLKIIKEGDSGTREEVYQWLSVKKSEILDEKFQVLAEKLYHSVTTLMQSVREKLEKNGVDASDYAYNNLELKPSRVYTNKNAACMKRLLEVYVGATPKKDFSYSLIDKFYYFIYPGEKLEKQRKDSYSELNTLMGAVPEGINANSSLMFEAV